jgi:hypothetical protein
VKVRLRLVGAAGVLCAAALLPLAATPASPAATPSAAPTCGVVPGKSWRIVSSTTPCQIVVPVGVSVPVKLSSSFRWSAPTSSSSAVTITSTHPAKGGLTGWLHAVHVGRAVVKAVGVMVCAPGHVCPALAMLWQLQVRVVAHLSSPTTVTVTELDAGTSVSLIQGDRLVVSLTPSQNYAWTEPRAADATVLRRLSGAAGHATFLAVGPGSTIVSAIENPDCYPACLTPSKLIQFHVAVTG